MNNVVIVGGSIAGVTAAGSLRALGWTGEITVLSDEHDPPYSRVPLSKGILAGTEPAESAVLPALPDDVRVRTGVRAVRLHTEGKTVELDNGELVPYDGLIVATGARPRRLAEVGQTGEHVVRTLSDAENIASAVVGARTAIVVGAGFLGMEVASTLRHHGLDVTVIDRDPPLLRLLGPWLADLIVGRATADGVRFILAPNGVELIGDPVRGVITGPGEEHFADLVVTAAGDLPNVEWLESSGLPLAGGLVVDDRCVVAPGIVAAGDVAVREVLPGLFRRTPHWTNAIVQGQAAARAMLDSDTAPYEPDHYFWTEQFGLDIKIAGELPLEGAPEVMAGDPDELSALLQWRRDDRIVAVAINHRMPVARLKAMTHA
ncbi:FAD-dependent oxidoreductase [Microbacterium sp. 2FI]|uniref:NAD(P)/FAD-dependent oxidoreductase n=1 Tax=Microbacterium sp. 2FI TaxID=2502193 RepID=UPI0010F9D0E6|nr:FAD-dependent oxidoreductase [Microbacterium sp. 2FI]